MRELDTARVVAIEPTCFDLTHFRVSPRAIAKKAKEVHANALRVGFFSHQGYAYYPSQVAPHAAGLDGRDLLAEFSDACAEAGLLLVVYANSRFDIEMARRHPDWIAMPKGKPFRLPGMPIYAMCLSSPYLDYYISIVSEIASRYRPKVLYVDNYLISFFCQCLYCVRGCQQELGFSPPTEPDWDSEEWLRYRDWLQARNLEGARKIAQSVKGIDPKIKVVFNRGSFWYRHSYPPSQTRDIANHVGDAVHMETNIRAFGQTFYRTVLFSQA